MATGTRKRIGDHWKYPNMMTSSNGNIFRVTGLLWGEFKGDPWILSRWRHCNDYDENMCNLAVISVSAAGLVLSFFKIHLPTLPDNWHLTRFKRYIITVAIPFTKEVNSRLAKHPLVFNGCLANRGLTSLVKEAVQGRADLSRTAELLGGIPKPIACIF